MEGITHLVTESMARHGFEGSIDHRRLRWSPWFRCESSFNLLLVPTRSGLFALAEELIPPGETAVAGGKRMLAIFQIAEAEELGVAMSRLFAPSHPLKARLESGSIFARFTIIEDKVQRQTAHAALLRWLATSAEAASGVTSDVAVAPASTQSVAQLDEGQKPVREHHQEVHPPPLFPSGF